MAAKKKRTANERGDWGAGSVYDYPKGSGKWFAALHIEGRLIRRRAASEQAAEAKLEELRELRRKHVDVLKGRQPYADWLLTCHKDKIRRTQPKPRSIEFDRDMMERYIVPKMGRLILLDIRPYHVQNCIDDVYDEIRREIDPRTGQPRYDGARTAHAVATILEETLTLASELRLIEDNPYRGIRLPKYRRKRIEPMDDAQCQAFYGAVSGQFDARGTYKDARGRVKRWPALDTRLQALWMSYLLLGLRRGEGLGVRWEDIDWEKRTIRVAQQVQRVNGREIHIGSPKTEDSIRTLPLTRRLFDLYREHRDSVEAEYTLKGLAWTGQGLIFSSEVDTPIWPDNLETMFRRIRVVAGLPATVKLHHLRHTLSTLLDECGATEALKAGILGHSKQTQTQKYTHARVDAMRAVLQAVEDRLLGGVVAVERTGT